MPVLTRASSTVGPIGLDIGTCGIRAVQWQRTAPGWSLVAMSHSDLRRPGESGDDAAPVPRVEQVRSCLFRGGFRNKRVVTGIASDDLEYYPLEIPEAVLESHQNASSVVAGEVRRLMTFPEAQATEARYWRLPPTNVPAPNALGIVGRRAAITDVTRTCTAAGLHCAAVDSTAAALCRLGSALRGVPEGEIWGILDLGAVRVRQVVCVGEVPVVVRPIADGGLRWTELIAESLELSMKSAEVQKGEYGIGAPPTQLPEEQRRGAAELSGLLLGALRPVLSKIASEVKRSYEYALGCYPSYHAGHLMLVGGGANLGGLPEYLNEQLGIDVRRAVDYLREDGCRLSFGATDRQALQVFAIAAGLALPA